MVRNGISSTMFGLTSASKKLSSKNLSLSSLFDMKKVETTILIWYEKGRDYHPVGLQSSFVDFLSFNVGLANLEI